MSTTSRNQTQIAAPAGVPWIDIVREFDAPVESLFRAHVEPDLVAAWLGPRDLVMTVGQWDARTGGRWEYTHARGEESYGFYGSFHEVRANQRIVQTFTFAGMPDAVALEVMAFEALPGGRSRLVSRSIGSSVEERDAMVASGMEHGIVAGYEKLDELLEQG